jgi:2-oxoisovalerate dehydrogenase E1 component beta subunit
LLASAIRSDDPVLFMEPKRVYRASKGEVPEGDYTVPIGKASVVREGKQVTVIAWGAMLHEALEAVNEAAKNGVDAELIDLRTLWPVDLDTILASVKKTGRVVVVHEAPRTCGFGSELVSLITERCFTLLEAPPVRVTGYDTPFPYTLENDYLPRAPRIYKALKETVAYEP